MAVLPALAEFHREPVQYDLKALVRLVADLHPDLLCLNLTSEQWQRREFGDLPLEYRDALLPLAYQTDIVVVPVAGNYASIEPSAPGWRGKGITLFRQRLAALQRAARGPDGINQGWRHSFANALYHGIAWLAGDGFESQWRAHSAHLSQAVLELVRGEPGRRVLVVVNVRHCHLIRNELRRHPEIEVTRYSEL